MIKLSMGKGTVEVHSDVFNRLMEMNIKGDLHPEHLRAAIQYCHDNTIKPKREREPEPKPYYDLIETESSSSEED